MSSTPRLYKTDTSTTAFTHKRSPSSPVLRRSSVTFLPLPAAPMSLPRSSKLVFWFPLRLRRRAFVAVFVLAAFSFCLLSSFPYSDSASIARLKTGPLNMQRALGTLKAYQHKPHIPGRRKQINLNAVEELAAVSSFLASLPHNVIPSFVDPSLPIDPQLVLDFDTRGPRAEQEVQAMITDVWTRNPVFLYSKMHSSNSREVKAILAKLNLYPSPMIIDVDIRNDVEVLMPLLIRLSGYRELPILIVSGKLVGPMSEIRALEKTGELRNIIAASGAVINGIKRKKHRNH
ncbi:hypothetical protein AX15_003237 [Amanita polypyramis BW_CC]|nr:hypothetical protein AX15_003237 [Amanita polypyramis BW_CC]